ncbi:Fe-S cluster assembly protein SufD [Flavobacteriales bacterium]|nr:Fe-S cluster assembly protein SufD [Flavobacteriales bacterium]
MHLKEKLISTFDQSLDQLSFQEKRKESMQRLKQDGFPTIRNEEWKYTNLQPLLKKEFELKASNSTITIEEINEYILKDTDTYLMVFLNGVFEPSLSSISCEKAHISTFKNANEEQQKIIEKYWGSCLPKQGDAFVSANNGLAQEGAFVYIPKSVVLDKPLQIVYASKNENPLFLQTRSLLVIEENGQAQITERHQNFSDSEVFTNAVTEIVVKQNAIADFYKIQNDNFKCSIIDNTWVNQANNCNCTVDTFSFGGKMVRNNLTFSMLGEHSQSNMRGITLIGKDQLVDHHTLVDHLVPNCLSNELYKGIYDHNAKGVFNGKVMVHPDAQKTNAFQSNNNLLLTDDASIDTKPQLEIYADDVACSHGCTIGQLDDEALFYLRARGIPKKEAQAMLMYAFANDVLNNVKIEELKKKLNLIIAEKIGVELAIEL